MLYYIDMIVIRILLDVKPDARERFVTHIQTEALEVREFTGCRRFDLFSDLTDPNRFFLYEEWADTPSFQAYRDSEYFVRNREQLFPLVAAPPDSVYYAGAERFVVAG